MNVIGKIIGLVAIALIILLLVNFRTVLPFIGTLMFGGNGIKSAQDISNMYVKQIQAIYPIPKLPGSTGSDVATYQKFREYTVGGAKTYGGASGYYSDFTGTPGLLYDSTGYNTMIDPATKEPTNTVVVVEKNGKTVSVTIVNLNPPQNLIGIAHVWLLNAPNVPDATGYVDLGPVQSGGRVVYKVDIESPDFSLEQYRHVKIIHPKDFTTSGVGIVQ